MLYFEKLAILACALTICSTGLAQRGSQDIPYVTVFYGSSPPENLTGIVASALNEKVKEKIPSEDYDLIVMAEANVVKNKTTRVHVCSVTVGFSKKTKLSHTIPNVRFNSIGISIDPKSQENQDQKWELSCIKKSLTKSLLDLADSDLDYIKFMASK